MVSLRESVVGSQRNFAIIAAARQTAAVFLCVGGVGVRSVNLYTKTY